MSRHEGTDGVNVPGYWIGPDLVKPQVPDNAATREVLLVDRRGAPLLVRQPRPVGFRKPEPKP